MEKKIEKELVKLLKTPGVCGYSVRESTITIYVEDENTARTLALPKFTGYEVKTVVSGRFEAL